MCVEASGKRTALSVAISRPGQPANRVSVNSPRLHLLCVGRADAFAAAALRHPYALLRPLPLQARVVGDPALGACGVVGRGETPSEGGPWPTDAATPSTRPEVSWRWLGRR